MKVIAKDIGFSYKSTDFPLFSHLSFQIEGPGFYSLFGFSGCGKSTLARLIAGEVKPLSGQVELSGIAQVLLCYNTERIPGWTTVGSHLTYVMPKGRAGLMERLVDIFGLEHLMNKKFFRLSMGQKNRVNLLRYLLQDFDLLICDEVMANVDEPSRNRILKQIKREFPNKLFLYISHNVEEVCSFSKTVYVMSSSQSDSGIGQLVEIQGLDSAEGNPVNEEMLQTRIIDVLRAASAYR